MVQLQPQLLLMPGVVQRMSGTTVGKVCCGGLWLHGPIIEWTYVRSQQCVSEKSDDSLVAGRPGQWWRHQQYRLGGYRRMSVLADGAAVVIAAVVWLNAAHCHCWAVWWAVLVALCLVAESLRGMLLQ